MYSPVRRQTPRTFPFSRSRLVIESQPLEVITEYLCRCGIAEAMEPVGFISATRPFCLHMPRLGTKSSFLAELRDHGEVPVSAQVIRQRNLVWPVAIDDRVRWQALISSDHYSKCIDWPRIIANVSAIAGFAGGFSICKEPSKSRHAAIRNSSQ